MKTAWCLQQVAFEGPGVFRAALEQRGYLVNQGVVTTQGLPQGQIDFLLIMGGPMSVNDPDPWIAQELAFVKTAIAQGIPVLGICFGAQLLARALDGTVGAGPTFEIGMVPVTLTDEGKADPVFGSLPGTFPVFQWHGEGITLPPETKPLLASADFPVQAFRAQERCYGLLFHPEMEKEGIQALCRECPEDVKKGKVLPAVIQSQASPYLPMLHQFADRLIGHLAQ